MARQQAAAAPSRPGSSGSIQVITRAGSILRALSGEREGLSLSAIADRVSLPKSTVHRLVSALEAEGMVSATTETGRYRVGPELVRLAGELHGDLRAELHPALERLCSTVNETVDLSILLGSEVAFVDQVPAPHRLRAVSAIGGAFPAHCAANGKALLAAFDDDALVELLPLRLPAMTDRTITEREALLEELATVRATGFALDREEHTVGISAIGALVRDSFGSVAAVSIPVPTPRFAGQEARLADALMQGVGAINARHGFT